MATKTSKTSARRATKTTRTASKVRGETGRRTIEGGRVVKDGEKKITLLEKTNPHVAGTDAAKRWDMLRKFAGKTVEAYIRADGHRDYLRNHAKLASK